MRIFSRARQRTCDRHPATWLSISIAILAFSAGVHEAAAQHVSRPPSVSIPRPMPNVTIPNTTLPGGAEAQINAAPPPAVAVPLPPPPPAAMPSNRRRPHPCWCYGYSQTARSNVRTVCSYDCCQSDGRDERC